MCQAQLLGGKPLHKTFILGEILFISYKIKNDFKIIIYSDTIEQ